MSLLRGRFLHLEETSPLTVYRVRLWRGRRASLLYNRKDTLLFIRKKVCIVSGKIFDKTLDKT